MFNNMIRIFCILKVKFDEDERGAAAMEYVLIAAAIATGLIAVLAQDGTFMKSLKEAFESIAGHLGTASGK